MCKFLKNIYVKKIEKSFLRKREGPNYNFVNQERGQLTGDHLS